MAQNVFNFSGPVTIHVTAAPGAASPPVVTTTPLPAAPEFAEKTLKFDENYGGEWGNCHVALGSSYSDTYDGDPSTLTEARKAELGFNDSALHWDLVNTERKRVTARLKGGGTRVIYEDGQFAC